MSYNNLLRKTRGIFSLIGIAKYIASQGDGDFWVTIERIKRKRSDQQNRYLWGVVYRMLLNGLLSAGYEFVDTEDVHEFFKEYCNQKSIVNTHTGEIITIPCSTKIMTTTEFEAYIQRLRLYGRDLLGVEIPEPNKYY